MIFKNYDKIIENGADEKLKNTRRDALQIINYALLSVDPYNAVESKIKDEGKKLVFKEKTIDLTCFEKMFLVGFGKASVGMADAVVRLLDIDEGAVITNESSQKVEDSCIETFVGGHPIPNEESIHGAEKILEIVEKCDKHDLLIVLISGGGSALFTKPRISLDDLQKVTNLLLKCGADINEINTVRKHLSMVKGGQLAKACKGTVVSLIISDIVEDPMSFIASGPTVPDSTTFLDAFDVLKKYDLESDLPASAVDILNKGVKGEIPDTADRNDPVFGNVYNFIIANNDIACKAAKEKAEELDYDAMILTTSLEGEAKDIGCFLADKALNYEKHEKNMVFIAGGETTVTVHGNGRGGRNQEMVLSAVGKIADSDLVFASFATDGVDGMSDAAGGIIDGFTLKRSNELGLDPIDFLANNDSYNFLKPLGDLFFTSPTGTNVMDLQIIVIN